VATTAERNVMEKGEEKKLKYKSLCVEIQWVWNLKCMIIPVIIGATGLVTEGWRKNLEVITWKHSIDSLQKTAVLGTSHIIPNVLQCEAGSLSGRDHRSFKRSARKKWHLTRDDDDNEGDDNDDDDNDNDDNDDDDNNNNSSSKNNNSLKC